MITYLTGDATSPIGNGVKIIAHVCNDIGAFGAGFVLALSNKWKDPERYYRFWHKTGYGFYYGNFELGNVQYVDVEDDIIVANMIAQEGIRNNDSNIPPIRYEALKTCLEKVNQGAIIKRASVHMPRIGAGLAGGDWNVIEKIINDTMSVDVFVYDLPKK